MNFANIAPHPTIAVHRPVKVSDTGNLYKIPLNHQNENGEEKKYEVWATKEAIKQHFIGQIGEHENPKEYQMRKFARMMYEKSMRNSGGQLQHNGLLVTTDKVQQGNPKLWPSTLAHPEIKY